MKLFLLTYSRNSEKVREKEAIENEFLASSIPAIFFALLSWYGFPTIKKLCGCRFSFSNTCMPYLKFSYVLVASFSKKILSLGTPSWMAISLKISASVFEITPSVPLPQFPEKRI